MRLPIRRSERIKKDDGQSDGPLFLTLAGIKRMQECLKRIEEEELPQAIKDVRTTAEFGDFSENAEYQEAKARMRRLHAQIFGLKEKLKRVSVIKRQGASDNVRLGSKVKIEANGTLTTFEIVGPQETNPARGRISHISPLGAALMGRAPGDRVAVKTNNCEKTYIILKIF